MDDATKTHTSATGAQGPHPWERLPEETDKDFATFTAYLRMPAPRSARALAQTTGLASRSLDRLRARFDWVNRAAAYDSHRIQQAMELAPIEASNPYERMLHQAANRAANLHDAANKLLGMATRRLDWAERAYMRAVDQAEDPESVEPPVPSANLVASIRGASEVMDKCAEAQALALGITDVLKMQQEVAQA
jgi:hypothetical protein